MLLIAVCDDEPVFLRLLADEISQYFCEAQLEYEIFTFSNPIKLYELVLEGKAFDYVFLDLEMPELNGFQLADQMRMLDTNFKLFFITSYNEKVTTAFRHGMANGFIFKSNWKQQLSDELNYIRAKTQKEDRKYRIVSVPENDIIQGTIKKDILIYTDSILYFNAEDKKTNFSLLANKKINGVRVPNFKVFAEEYGKQDFIQTHRSFVVNARFIKGVAQNEIELVTGEKVPMAPLRRKKVETRFSEYLRKQYD